MSRFVFILFTWEWNRVRFNCDTICFSVSRCINLDAIMHIAVGESMFIWVYMHIGIAYMHVHAGGYKYIWVCVCIDYVYVHGCVCIVVSKG